MTAPPRYAPLDHITRPDRAHRPDHDPAEQPTDTLPAPKDEQRFTLSATQITASMAAAVTAAMVGSKLGVAGTVIGAGLASVISVVGGAIFGHSILLTRKQVKRAVLQVRGSDREPADQVAPDDVRTVVIPAVTRFDLPSTERALSGPDRRSAPERGEPRRPRPTRRKLGAGLLVGVAAAATIFAGSLAAVTLVETVKGSPLSGGDSGGLSVLGGTTGTDSGTSVDAPATTTEVTAVSTVTQTVTSQSSAPATSESSTPAQSSSRTGSSSTGSSTAPSTSASSSSAPTSPTTAPSPAVTADAALASNASPTPSGLGGGAGSVGK